MSVLETLYQRNLNIEKRFKYRAILAILPEALVAPVVTLMEGFQELGFRIYVIGKSNINSWFVNEVVNDPGKIKFDFVLSALTWGTRWDYYSTFGLHNCFKVLVDAADNRGANTWRQKYNAHCQKYRETLPTEEVAMGVLQPYRWMAPLSGYEPNMVFVSQKVPGVNTQYLPFGIWREYLALYEKKRGKDRKIDFAAIPGTGPQRRGVEKFLAGNPLPGCVFNKKIHGEMIVAKEIRDLAMTDNLDLGGGRRTSSYGAWVQRKDYFKTLNDTKVLIFPGISEKTPWWDARRPWEAHASGCLVLYKTPTIDMAQYPVLELCKEAIYDTFPELVSKCKYFYRDQARLERLRLKTVKGAMKYFTAVPLARHFLAKVRSGL